MAVICDTGAVYALYDADDGHHATAKVLWALLEKGGLNLDNPSPLEQIEADDNYCICARRGSLKEAKSKKPRRKSRETDE